MQVVVLWHSVRVILQLHQKGFFIADASLLLHLSHGFIGGILN